MHIDSSLLQGAYQGQEPTLGLAVNLWSNTR